MADSGDRAIVLLSGGIDSAVSAAIALERRFEVFALSFRYGQRHSIECDAAAKIARSLAIQHHAFVDLDLRAFGGSALTSEIAVPKLSSGAAPPTDQIPITYVPARNTIFLSFALAQAEVVDARAIFIGVNALDYSGYPDCRPDFINAFEQLAKVATRAGADGHPVKIHAPLIRMSKSEIIREGLRLSVDFSLTHSCYDPTANSLSCGRCESCYYRRKGFEDAGVADPTRYA